jgi:hypothetical protein
MPMYMCPRCKTMSIPLKDKYMAGMWANIYCSHCKAKLCATPLLLAAFYILYLWDVGWFSGLFYYTRDWIEFVYMAIIWVILDYINVTYLPMSIMKRDPQPP